METVVTLTEIPKHVPRELVREFDIYRIPGADEDVHLAWKRVKDGAPDVFYTPCNGGYWVLNHPQLIEHAFPDFEHLASSRAIAIPTSPAGTPPQYPIECDPPLHKHVRQPINIAVAPRALQAYGEQARRLTIELIEALIPRGRCEFMGDFARILPMTIFLRMVDLPLSDRERLIGLTDRMIREQEIDKRMQVYGEVMAYLDQWVRERRDCPGADLISAIAAIRVDGLPLSHEETLGECAQVLFGGLDTVAGTMGFFMRFLAQSPSHRRQLVNDPGLIPAAVEELLRRHSIPSVARRLTADMSLGGVQMLAGDMVMLSPVLHGLDERAWKDALTVDFSRVTSEHMAFGKGIHKCPGANLARRELIIVLEEWTKRIPDFWITAGDHAVTTDGQVMGVRRLPLSWAR